MDSSIRNNACVIYTRVSTDEQAQYGTSLEGQREACLRKARELGLVVLQVFEEPGVSGGLFDGRPQLQAAMAVLERRLASVLLATTVSRLSRDVEHLAMIRRKVTSYGARLTFVDMDYSNNASGKLALYLTGAIAEGERDTIRERSVSGKLRRIGDGIQPSRNYRPFGYDIVKKVDVLRGLHPEDMLGHYVIVEEEATWVREIFTRYRDGLALFSIGRFLHDNGVPTIRGGKAWHPNTLAGILKNPIYFGRATYGKRQRIVDSARLLSGHKRADYNQPLPESQWKFIPAPPIVDEATWNACQTRLRENRERMSGNNDRRYWLTGLLKCPNCGRSLRAKKTRVRAGEPAKYVHYHCRDYSKRCYLTGDVCHDRHYNMAWLETSVGAAFEALSERPELVDEALKAYRVSLRVQDVEAEYDRLTKERKALANRENATIQAQISAIERGASPTLYDAVFVELEENKSGLDERLRILERRKAIIPEKLTDAEALKVIAANMSEVLNAPEITPIERHRLLARVVKSIIPNNEELSVVLRPWPQDDPQSVRLIVMRRSGNSRPVLRMALRTRSLDSFTAASGRPTIENMGTDVEMSTSTRTI